MGKYVITNKTISSNKHASHIYQNCAHVYTNECVWQTGMMSSIKKITSTCMLQSANKHNGQHTCPLNCTACGVYIHNLMGT